MLDKEKLIQFIKENDLTYRDVNLKSYSFENLVIIKVRIELEKAEKKMKKKK